MLGMILGHGEKEVYNAVADKNAGTARIDEFLIPSADLKQGFDEISEKDWTNEYKLFIVLFEDQEVQ